MALWTKGTRLRLLNGTDSSSSSSGALVIDGGVGVAKSINVGGELSITSATASTSTTTGALKVTGGLGLGENLVIGGSILFPSNGLIAVNTTDENDNGSLFLSSGSTATAPRGGYIQLYGQQHGTNPGQVIIGSTTVAGSVQIWTSNTQRIGVALNGGVTMLAGIASTTTGTGTLVVTGGVGVSGTVYASSHNIADGGATYAIRNYSSGTGMTMSRGSGANTVVNFANDASNVAYGSVLRLYNYNQPGSANYGFLEVMAGGAENGRIDWFNGGTETKKPLTIYGNTVFNTDGTLSVTTNVASTTTGSGSLVVTGGIGVSGQVTSASIATTGGITSGGVVTISNSTAVSGAGTGALQVTGGISTGNSIYASGTADIAGATGNTPAFIGNLQFWSNHSTGFAYIQSGSTRTNGSWLPIRFNPMGNSSTAYFVINSTNVTVPTTTVASSTTTGALIVGGGAGIAGDLYAANIISSGNLGGTLTTPVQSNITSVGTLTTLTSSGQVNITNATASTSRTTGALIVTGGIGTSGDIYGGNNLVLTNTVSSSNLPSITMNGNGGAGNTISINMSPFSGRPGSTAIKIDAVDDGLSGAYLSVKVASGSTSQVATEVLTAYTTRVNVVATTVSTNTTSGAFQVAGGVGIAGALYGTTANFSGNITGTLATPAQGNVTSLGTLTGLTSSGIVNITNTTATVSTTTGALTVTGGIGAGGSIYTARSLRVFETSQTGTVTAYGQAMHVSGNTMTNSGTVASGTLADYYHTKIDNPIIAASNTNVTTTNATTLYVTGAPTTGTNNTITNAYALWIAGGTSRLDGILSITDATVSSSTTSGALLVSGGIGVSGQVTAGTVSTTGTIGSAGLSSSGDIVVTSGTESTSTTTGAVRITGGLAVTGALFQGGDHVVTSATAATSKTTGAVRISGGLGVAGDTWASRTYLTDNTNTFRMYWPVTATGIAYDNATAGTTISRNNFTISSAGAGAYQTEIRLYALGLPGSTNQENLQFMYSSTGGTIAPITSGSGVARSLTVYTGTTFNTDGTVSITNNTTSSSPTTGALKVTGGVGVQGALYVAGAVYSNGVQLTGSPTLTAGTNISTAGSTISVIDNPSFSGVVTITNNSVADSTTTGALRVTGGVGVQGALYVAGAVYSNGVQLTGTPTLTAGTNISTAGSVISVIDNPSFSGIVTVTNATASTSKTTGALVVTGGIGTSGAVNIGGSLTLHGATSGNVSIIAPATVSGNYTLTLPTGAPTVNGMVMATTTSGVMSFMQPITPQVVSFSASNNVSTPTAVTGVVGSGNSFVYRITSIISAGANSSTSLYTLTATLQSDSTYNVDVVETGPVEQLLNFDVQPSGQVRYTHPNIAGWVSTTLEFMDTTVGGIVKYAVTDVTDSSSVLTGALTVAGGVGISKSVYIGGRLNITLTTDSSSTSSGALVIDGGLAVKKKTYLGGDIIFSDSSTNFQILTNTIDGSDNRRIFICAGGAFDTNRGAYINMHGQQHATEAGNIYIGSPTVTGYISLDTQGSARMRISNGGEFDFNANNLRINRTGFNAGYGIRFNANDGYLLSVNHDPYTSGTYNGAGRWGMVMMPANLCTTIAGITGSLTTYSIKGMRADSSTEIEFMRCSLTMGTSHETRFFGRTCVQDGEFLLYAGWPYIKLQSSSSGNHWRINHTTGWDLDFAFNDVVKASLFDQNSYAPLNFTGQHRTHVAQEGLITFANIADYIGHVVVCSGEYVSNDINIMESVPKIELASQRNDKRVFGVVADAEDPSSTKRSFAMGMFVSHFDKDDENDHRIIVNSLGEGAVWVCNINGNLQNGDLLTTCEVQGMAMRQDDDLLRNYTLGKITCDCDFDLTSTKYKCEEFTYEGVVYRRAFVGLIYYCG